MNAVLSPHRMTAQEYLDWETVQETKNEYIDGEIVAMSGARINHNRIAGNGYAWLKQALRGEACQAFISDIKLHVAAANAYYYPDVVVTCDPQDLADGRALAVQHPWLVVEVLSDSTAATDRGLKFEHYRLLDSLTHYLLVETTRPRAELFRRNPQGQWVLFPMGTDDVLRIDEPHPLDWPIATLFEGISFDARPQPPQG